MKCIHCGTNANYRTRQASGRCPKCHHPYAFEPKDQRPKLTDLIFDKAVQSVSFDGQLYFTRRQLWHEINRRLWRKQVVNLLVGSVISLFFLLWVTLPLAQSEPAIFTTIAVVALIGLVAWAFYVKFGLRPRPLLPEDQFERALQRWGDVHGQPETLLSTKALRIELRGQEADLTDYGFERLVVTEQMSTAAMLLANRLHLEKKCAILSAEDLTSPGAELILKTVTNSPQLTVLVAHDASTEGCDLSRRLQQEPWFRAGDFKLVDLGLRPAQVRKLKLFALSQPGAAQAVESVEAEQLSTEEIRWLGQGYYAELEGLRPRALLHAIARGFAPADERNLPGAPVFAEGIFWVESFG